MTINLGKSKGHKNGRNFFFEFQFVIGIPCGAPQHSAASNGAGHVGRSRGGPLGGPFAKKNSKA